MDKKGNNFAFCSTENECRNLVFLLVLTSRIELFVKKYNCRNLSLIRTAVMVATCVALLFTAQKEYFSTLWTVQTLRFCFNHESKCLRIVSEWLLYLSSTGGHTYCLSLRDANKCEYDCSLFQNNLLLERLGIRVMKRTVGYLAFRRALSINLLPRAILDMCF